MMEAIDNAGNGVIVEEIAAVIVANKAYLSEIDGKIGDGDHGVGQGRRPARRPRRVIVPA